MLTIREYCRVAREKKATDIYFNTGSPPWFRIDGELHPLENDPTLRTAEIEELALALLSPENPPNKKVHLEQDMIAACTIEGMGRLRIAFCKGRNGSSLACRLIPSKVPDFEGLGLPMALKHMASTQSGLILIIGRAGSGKTTTLASLINIINQQFEKSIITIEQPIEFVHPHNRSFIEQTQPHETENPLENIRHSGFLRSADVIAIDGLQPEETLSPALSAAAEGILVLATVASNGGVAEVLKGFLDDCPDAERNNRRRLLAQTLRGAVWQHLLPLKSGQGFIPAVELLINDPVISRLVSREGNLHLIRPTMAAGRHKGMQTMHQALEYLKQKSLVREDILDDFQTTMLTHYVYPARACF